MDDLISRQAAIDAVNSRKTAEQCKEGEVRNWTVDACVDMIKQLPSAQPEIIRCRDCKHRTSYWGDCKLWEEKYHQSVLVGCDEFCSMAERSSNE